MLLLALTTPLVLLGMLLGMHAVERRLDGEPVVVPAATPGDSVPRPDVVTLPDVVVLPGQREGLDSERVEDGRSLSA